MADLESKPDYGIDFPKVVRNLIIVGSIFLLFGILQPFFARLFPAEVARVFTSLVPAVQGPGYGFVFAAMWMLWGSKIGKLKLRDNVLNALALRGNERVLDVGCGRGLMLIGAAQRLRTGKAIGLDLWSQQELTGNSAEATLGNAQLESVSHRVEVQTGDARKLEFESATFDLLLSSWALHNLESREERNKALAEIVRVLKPGGRVVIIDIRHAREYAQFLHQQGLEVAAISAPNFLFLLPTYTLLARKAAAF